MSIPTRPDESEPYRAAKANESGVRGDKTAAAERAKTVQANQINGYPAWAAKNGITPYTPHAQGPTPSGAPLGAGAGQGPAGSTGSWQPMNNANGSFNPQSSQRPLPVSQPEPRYASVAPNYRDAINGRATGHESAGDFASIAARNAAIYAPHDPVRIQNPDNINSRLIQNELNAAAGVTHAPGTRTYLENPYGTASGIFSRSPQTEKVVTSTGVSHPAASDPVGNAAARIVLQQSHPDIFQEGTYANKAFVAYAQQHGEAAAHANIDKIIPSPHAFSDANPAPESVINQPTAANKLPPLTPY